MVELGVQGASVVLPANANRPLAIPRDVFLVALCAIGIGFRLVQWVWAPSQWLDEIALSRNILDNPLWQLLTAPLAYDQVAPKGFLLVSRIAVGLFGTSDHVLRILPIIGAVVAMLGFTALADSVLRPQAARLAVAGFAFAAPLICYGATVKQYSTDVAVAILLYLVILRLDERVRSGGRADWTAFVIGTLAPWFSQPATLLLGAGGMMLLVRHGLLARPSRVRQLVLVVGMWAVSCAVALLDGFRAMTPETAQFMHLFWANGFPPPTWGASLAQGWPWPRIAEIFGSDATFGLSYPFGGLYAAFTLLGLAWFSWRSPRVAMFFVAPVAVSILAAALRQYPFEDRVVLFLMPVWFIGLGSGFDGIAEWLPTHQNVRIAVSSLLAIPTLAPVLLTPPPYQFEDVKPVMAAIREKARVGDKYFVHYGGAVAFDYYASQYGITSTDVLIPRCNRGDTPSYYRAVDTLRGQPRVWVFLTHVLPFTRERQDILAYVDAIGTRRDEITRAPRRVQDDRGSTIFRVEAFLYDLSSSKGAEVSAETFPVTGPRVPNPRVPCGRGPNAILKGLSWPSERSS